ncbi:MAG: NUDIX domain-containing protein, partial [Candidatus Parcubacteria bacterium]|nr:NUDIX domain-containing protein [Candidatus Parcubacteria bacterium]
MKKGTEWIPSELYIEMMNHLPICCVDIMIFNTEKTKILLCKRSNEPLKGEYFSPGGRLLKNEELKAGAVRQAKRELGIKINPKQVIFGGIISEIYPNSAFGKDIGYHAVVIYFGYVATKNTNIILDNQHSDYKWFDVSDKTI